MYSTYLGGQSEDAATAIAVDSAGNAHVAGYSGSPDFPVTGDALQPARAGTNTDAFVSVLNPAGTGLVYSSYLGGTGNIQVATRHSASRSIQRAALGSWDRPTRWIFR